MAVPPALLPAAISAWVTPDAPSPTLVPICAAGAGAGAAGIAGAAVGTPPCAIVGKLPAVLYDTGVCATAVDVVAGVDNEVVGAVVATWPPPLAAASISGVIASDIVV